MDDKLIEIRNFYNKYADKYNEKRIIKGGALFNEFIEIPATKYLLRGHRLNGKKVLDIGCGIGVYTNYLNNLGAEVTAIDISEKMISIAKKNCSSDKIVFINDSFESYPFTEKYSFIIGGFMLSYFFDLKKAFSKINTLLTNDGLAIFSMLHPVKLSLKSKNDDMFCLANYFDENDYHTDLSFGTDEMAIKKWNLEDISKAAKENNLFIDDFLEPRPDINIGIDDKDFIFYHKCPSVISFKFKKRNNYE